MKTSKDSKDIRSKSLDPEKLLAWGDSQLKKIQKEKKWKKSNSGDENYSNLKNKTSRIVKVSCTEKKETKIFQEDSEEKKERLYRRSLESSSRSVNSNCDKLEMKENVKSKKKKKDKRNSISVNIELNKGDISYETNFSSSKKKKHKKRCTENCDDEIKIKKSKKGSTLESNKNTSKNKESYLMCIKLTKLDNSDNTTKEGVNEDIKSKHKKKKKKSVDAVRQEEIVENALSLPKKKRKNKKDKNKDSDDLKEISDHSENIYKKIKKIRKSSCTEHLSEKIPSDVNKFDNEVDINDESFMHIKKKKCKKRTSSEHGESDSPTSPKKKKNKKENTEILDPSSELVYMSDTSSCIQSHKDPEKKKKKRKKNVTDVMEEVSNEIYVKKKKKKKREKSMDRESTFSGSCLSTYSHQTEGSGKFGLSFGKSAISRLLSNRELCGLCSEVNIKCSEEGCNNTSNNPKSTDNNDKGKCSEKDNDTQGNILQNSSVVIKQEKIDTDVQSCLPANITIKQEKIDESFDNPKDICREITLNPNIQVKQEVLDIPVECSSNQKENSEKVCISNTDVINNPSNTHEIENVVNDINNTLKSSNNNINNIPISSNNIDFETYSNVNKNSYFNENENKKTGSETNEQFYMDSYESYYNFCDDKLTIHEHINQLPNHVDNSLIAMKIEKTKNVVKDNKEILQKEVAHIVNSETHILHPNQNADTTNSVFYNGEVSKEEICQNNIQNENVNHSPIADTKHIIEQSQSLDYIPLLNLEQCNQAETNSIIMTVPNNNYAETNSNISTIHDKAEINSVIRTVHNNNSDIHEPLHQRLNRFQSDHQCHNPTENNNYNKQRNFTHEENRKSLPRYQDINKYNYYDSHHSSVRKSILFCGVRPQFKLKEPVSRILKVDTSQVEFCYYRMSSKNYQDIHVTFSDEHHFQKVVRYYANRIRCKSWRIRDDKRRRKEDSKNKK